VAGSVALGQLAGLSLTPSTGVEMLEAVALSESPDIVTVKLRILQTGSYQLAVSDTDGTHISGKPASSYDVIDKMQDRNHIL
jgi:hypothetical protein